ncbi:MAG: hypothetical protein ABI580_10930 [Burkholderiaceae bacterium]
MSVASSPDQYLLLLPTMSSPLPDAVPLSAVRRVLVTKLRHHGDVLLTSPVFSTLARAAPSAEIDALVYAETAPMLAHHPAIAQLHTIDRDWKKLGVIAQYRAEWARLPKATPRHAVEANLDALRRIGIYPDARTSASCCGRQQTRRTESPRCSPNTRSRRIDSSKYTRVHAGYLSAGRLNAPPT